MSSDPRTCARCVMDTTAPGIEFDSAGVCNYCVAFEKKWHEATTAVADHQAHRDEFIARVKADGRGKDYDCIIGISGGVDSSYGLLLAVKNGLRPLAVHLDNGWNSELAAHNITNLVQKLGVDLYTHVIDWRENRDLQLSFIKAHVVDIELLMDNAMLTLNYSQAAKHGLKYVLSGNNLATEGMRMPEGWYHFKFDVRNVRRIHKRFGSVPIRTHLLMSTLDYVWYEFVRRIKRVPFLDYFPYNKVEAVETLKKEVGYKPYPYKHYESVFTRFYQAYILPRKFGYDKRRVHLSSLIVSGQMSRDEALELLSTPPYPDPQQQEKDRVYVLKKLGLTDTAFDEYMRAPGIPHSHYGTEEPLNRALVKVYKLLRGS